LSLEEAEFIDENLPLLPKIVRIAEDGSTIMSKHAPLSVFAHEADTVTKVFDLALLLNQDGNKVCVGLEIDALTTT
jgi:hypothetical protein